MSDYDAADNVFIGDNATVTGPGGTASGIYFHRASVQFIPRCARSLS